MPLVPPTESPTTVGISELAIVGNAARAYGSAKRAKMISPSRRLKRVFEPVADYGGRRAGRLFSREFAAELDEICRIGRVSRFAGHQLNSPLYQLARLVAQFTAFQAQHIFVLAVGAFA
jgi:hypothetical protein